MLNVEIFGAISAGLSVDISSNLLHHEWEQRRRVWVQYCVGLMCKQSRELKKCFCVVVFCAAILDIPVLTWFETSPVPRSDPFTCTGPILSDPPIPPSSQSPNLPSLRTLIGPARWNPRHISVGGGSQLKGGREGGVFSWGG